MTDSKTKAIFWPRAESAADLATLLRAVKSGGGGKFQWTAAAPCHVSNSGKHTSFLFGDAPGGGLHIGCYRCCTPGMGTAEWKAWIDRCEDALGVALQIQMPDGGLRYKARGENASRIQRRNYSPSINTGLYATSMPCGLAVAELAEQPFWFAGSGKQGWTTYWNGVRYGWRQSKDASEGGVKLARYGGECVEKDKPMTIKPWRTYADMKAVQDWAEAHGRWGVRPSISLAGDAETPASHAVVILDVDYKPAADQGYGQPARDAMRLRMVDAGMAIYTSNSGNGFHAIGLIEGKSFFDFTWAEQTKHKFAEWMPFGPKSKEWTGLSVDIFLPGARFLVAVNLHKPGENTAPDHKLPHLTAGDVNTLLTGRKHAINGEPVV